jgi:hypothetical protein
MASDAAGKEVSGWLLKQGQQQQQQNSSPIGIEKHDPDSRSVLFTVDNTTFSIVYPDSYPNSTEDYLVSDCPCRMFVQMYAENMLAHSLTHSLDS